LAINSQLSIIKRPKIRQRVLYEKFSFTATSYNNVAFNLDHQGKYEEAAPLFRKSYKMLSELIG